MKLFIFAVLLPTLLVLSTIPAEARRRAKRASTSSSSAEDGDAMLRVLSAEDRRTKDKYLLSALHHPSRRVVKQATLAIGRLGESAALDDVMAVFRRKDNDLKKTAAFALSLMNSDDTALKILVQNIPMQTDPDVIAALYSAVGRLGGEKNVVLLAGAVKDATDERVQRAACEGLGLLWSGPSEKWDVPTGTLTRLMKLSASANEDVAIACAFAVARYKGDAGQLTTADLLEAAAKTPKAAKPLLLRALSRNRATTVTAVLVQEAMMSDTIGIRIEAAKSLATHPLNDNVNEAFRKLLGDDSAHVVVQALEAIAYHGATGAGLTTAVDGVYLKPTNSNWVRGIALKALTTINPPQGHLRIKEVLAAPSSPLLNWAVSAMAVAPNDADLVKLAEYVNHDNYRLAEEAIDGLGALGEEKFTPALKAALKKALERGDAALSTLAAQLVEKHKWKDFASSLATVLPLFTQADQIEPKTAILSALGAVGDHSHVPVIEASMKDSERAVVVAAADALRAITGKDESARVPANSHPAPLSFSTKEISEAQRARVLIKTTRGEIEMKMLDVAPLTALNFVRLVKKKFYDGKTFHRVVPDFVVQGGDPRGDGYGSAGYLIRDELSATPHLRGTVGMATAGRDTGGSQFFVNTAPNLHLDGRYTVFAELAKGIEVVEKIEVGDSIVSAKVL